jgi:pyruvate-formate lyase-activating enzyme
LLSENGGGVPLFQAEFLAETTDQLDGLHILLDMSGYASSTNFERVASRVDMLYLDIKSLVHLGINKSLVV